jgi:DNA-binding Lrp family transcriptional regulator
MTKHEGEVLALLKDNARMPISDIASSVGISEASVKKLIQKLESNHTIIQYTTVTDDNKLNKESGRVKAQIEVRVRPEKKLGFGGIARRIAKHPNVIDLYLISGQYDFLLIVEGDSLEEISRFVSDKLASIENVQSTATHFIMRTYKEKSVLIDSDEAVERLAIQA